MKYTYARLGRGDLGFCRFFGEGLGNTLFPWARSMVAARKDHLTEIWPAWRQVFHRGGWRDAWKEAAGGYGLKNLRNYDTIFQPTGTQVVGLRKLTLLLKSRNVTEAEYLETKHGVTPDGCVVFFEGMGNQFSDLTNQHDFLRAELWKRTAPDIRVRVNALDLRRSISVHVRMGDFPDHRLDDVLKLRHNSRLPQSWYVEKIQQVRASLDQKWPVAVFSDGLDSELAEVLAVPNSQRVSLGNALADMWAMASSGVLVCSLSTLNNWACYLGQPPAIRLRGLMRQPMYTDVTTEIESGEGEPLPPAFIEAVRRKAWRDSSRNPGQAKQINIE